MHVLRVGPGTGRDIVERGWLNLWWAALTASDETIQGPPLAPAWQVGVHDGEAELDLLAGALVETVVEDRLHAAVAVGAERHGPTRGGLQAVLTVAVGQAQDAQAGAERLLGVASRTKHCFDQGRGVRSDGSDPTDEALGRPLPHLSMLLGHAFVDGPTSGRLSRVVALRGSEPLPPFQCPPQK